MKHDKRTLYLVRHAKASRSIGGLTDIDRPLAELGTEEAYRVAEELFNKQEIPELIISSTAVRAFSTALIFRRVLQVPITMFKVTDRLYEIDINDLVEFIADLDDRYHSIMLVGHNPSFSMLASKLQNGISHVSTAGVVKFEFDVEKWRHASYINAENTLFLVP